MRHPELTRREDEVMALTCRTPRPSLEDIAVTLGISPDTARHHRNSAVSKLGGDIVVAALAYARWKRSPRRRRREARPESMGLA